jgi:hypothetical protein
LTVCSLSDGRDRHLSHYFGTQVLDIDADNVWHIKNYRKREGRMERAKLRFTRNHVFRWDD